MTDEHVDYEQEARQLGWVPEEQFRGDKTKWVDAKTFYERGQSIMPVLKQNNKKLEQELHAVRQQLAEQQALFKETQESIEALKEFHSENTRRKVQQAKVDLIAQIKQAKADGDVDTETALLDQLQQANIALKESDDAAARKEAEKKKPVASAQPQVELDPDLIAFLDRNPDLKTDARKWNKMMSIGSALRANSDFDHLVGKAFYDKIQEELDAGKSPAHDKVEGGSRPGGGSSSKKGYAQLDAEAKRQCDADEKRFVGPNRMFKTQAEWRTYFAEQVLGE